MQRDDESQHIAAVSRLAELTDGDQGFQNLADTRQSGIYLHSGADGHDLRGFGLQ